MARLGKARGARQRAERKRDAAIDRREWKEAQRERRRAVAREKAEEAKRPRLPPRQTFTRRDATDRDESA